MSWPRRGAALKAESRVASQLALTSNSSAEQFVTAGLESLRPTPLASLPNRKKKPAQKKAPVEDCSYANNLFGAGWRPAFDLNVSSMSMPPRRKRQRPSEDADIVSLTPSDSMLVSDDDRSGKQLRRAAPVSHPAKKTRPEEGDDD